ncbi:MAG: Bug family tripartite tricarboxylate transporter substrate binding protein [Pseudolabrys sp.]
MSKRLLVAALFAAAIAGSQSPAAAQYPSGPAKLVVGFAPGGGNDILARIVADKLQAHFGKPFVVENRPGANGVIAIDAVKRSTPDGLTLLVGPSSGMTVNPVVLKTIPYDPVKDFEPIALVGSFPLIVVVKADSPIKSLQDLVARAKAAPGTINYSSAATSFQVAPEAFAQKAGIKMMNIPYRGSAPAATAVVTNDVAVNFGDSSAVLPLIQGGQMRALAVTTAKRIPSLPEVPTVAESGYPGFEMVFWSGLFLPAGTPEDIRKMLETEVGKIVAMPDILARMKTLGVEPTFAPGAALGARVKSEIELFRKVAESAGIKAE